MEIKSISVPSSPRSKRYPSGSTIIRNSGGGTTVVGGGGSSLDVLKSTSGMPLSDANVLSSLRTLIEIRKHFVAKDDTGRELTDTNSFSSLRTVAEIDKAIADLKTFLESNYLSKVKDDRAAGTIAFEKDITVGQQATTLNLLVNALAYVYDLQVDHVATLFQTIIKDFVSSETFVPGMVGEGMKLYKAFSGDWNLELDNVTVRKAITTFEMVIAKLRAVNGGLVVSSANGSVKSVSETTGDPTYYVLGIEGDMTFIADDLIRCQVFTAGRVKHYWVPIEQINGDSILLLKSGFPSGVTPAVGDELVQMGNRTDANRQGVLYLTASEDGRPRFSVLDGINSPSLDGRNNTVLGCLDGITDTDLPADFQPSGHGLYSMNVFLKGVFILRNGKSIDQALTELSTQIEAVPGQISLKVTEEVGKMQIGGRNYVLNSHQTYSVGTVFFWQRVPLADGMIAGETYILSLQAVHNDSGIVLMLTDHDNTSSQQIAPGVPFELITPKKYFAFTNNGFGQDESFYNIKIEKGTKATDWTPAPEDIETRMSQAELSLQPENIWLGIKSNVQSVAGGSKTLNIDARGLDENMYYPVIIPVPPAPMTTLTLYYTLEGIKPSWATHGSGFSVQIRWSTNGHGWGTIAVQRIIHEATQGYCSGNAAGNIGQIAEYNKEYIYVRGGGFYHLKIEGGAFDNGCDAKLYPNGYQEGGDPYVRRIDPVSSVTFPVASIPAIVDTGIDIANRKIVLSADKTVFRNNSGGEIAIFENDRIKADLIDARQIIVDGLNAGRISTGNLDVTNGARIGDWTIEGGSIVSRNAASAKILVEPSGTRFLRINDNLSSLMSVRADGVTGISIYTQDTSGTCLSMTAQTGGTAIRSYGTHRFNARTGESIYFSGCVEMSGLCLKTQRLSGGQIGDHDVFIRMIDTSSDPTLTLPYPSAVGRVVFICTRNRRIYINGGSKYIRRDGSLRTQVDVSGADRMVIFIYDGEYWSYGWFNN